MQPQYLTEDLLNCYQAYLYEEEKSEATVQKYLRDIRAFKSYLKARPVAGRETVIDYKQWLESQGYAVSSINSMLVAINGLLAFLGRPAWRVHLLRQQRDAFGLRDRELTRQEYLRLVQAAAARGDERLALLLQTICATGIRVSELRAVTVTALKSGQTQIFCKGKVRRILLPQALCVRLRGYCRKRGIRQWQRVCDAQRCPYGPQQYLDFDETALPSGGGGGTQGVSAQPEASVCPDLL